MVIDLQTTITDITVFRTCASLVRKGTIHLEAGEHTLSITKLPRLIEENKVQVSVQPPEIKILGVEVITRSEPAEDSLSTPETEAKVRLETDQNQAQELDDTLKILASRQSILESLFRSASAHLGYAIAEGKAEPERINVVTAFVVQELMTLSQERRELNQVRKRIQDEIDALQGVLKSTPTRAKTRQLGDVNVRVEVSEATQAEFSITYSVSEASWEPLYDLHLRGARLTLTYQAILRQKTGEDWPLRPLILSTAASHQMPDLSLPQIWRLDRLAESVFGRERKTDASDIKFQMSQTQHISALPRPNPSPEPAPEKPQMEVVETGPTTHFRTAHPLAVPHNGSALKTDLAVIDLEAPLDYASVPKVASQVVLRSKIRNSSPFTLIPGSAILFQGDTYVGQTQIGMVAPGEEFVLLLGVEDRIRIQRTRSGHKVITLTKPPVGRITHTYQITVRNFLEKTASVTVRDQIPTSVHGDIRVTLVQASPEPTPKRSGEVDILKWQVEVPPQGTQVITYTFEVEYPKDMQITGIL